ncbi:ribonuclease domain-containing protein [Lysobacter sp. H23M47]|uniref:ribonuclease domain-containing protein n=1 Tax=Lysobacter sp. H23M47 TaxID=2781024 RepID=UPI0018819856|nr:ribonuclease domain-containing protein [Lysobacter sp. H23M47]QOW24579.1 ribonuclease [Lysobacter sp. H23M47]
MDRTRLWLVAAVIVAGLWSWSQYRQAPVLPSPPTVQSPAREGDPVASANSPTAAPAPAKVRQPRYPTFLPVEAHPVLDAIARGGPYAYRQDDGVFQNRERLLPQRPRGHYREYTVPSPGAADRGARRIVTGGDPPTEYFYTDDHYGSFRPFEVTP